MTDNDANKQAEDPNAMSIDANIADRLKLAEMSFKSVLDSHLHEDDKAGRILGAMAFLTAVAAGIFSVVHSSESLQKPELIFGSSIPVLAFAAYILFVLVGTTLYLGALGPNFNWPSLSQKKPSSPSLLFFKNIASNEAIWVDSWNSKTIEQIRNQLVDNYIHECLLIAQKEEGQVKLMTLGSWFFRIAIFFLALLTATLFAPEAVVIKFSLWLGSISILVSFLCVYLILPPKRSLNFYGYYIGSHRN